MHSQNRGHASKQQNRERGIEAVESRSCHRDCQINIAGPNPQNQRRGGHGIEPANLVHGIEATKLRPRNRDREIKIGKVRSRNRAQTPDRGYGVDGAESSLWMDAQIKVVDARPWNRRPDPRETVRTRPDLPGPMRRCIGIAFFGRFQYGTILESLGNAFAIRRRIGIAVFERFQ